MTSYDAIIIGTGQAGPALARRLAGSGMTVAIIERGHERGVVERLVHLFSGDEPHRLPQA